MPLQKFGSISIRGGVSITGSLYDGPKGFAMSATLLSIRSLLRAHLELNEQGLLLGCVHSLLAPLGKPKEKQSHLGG